MITLLKLVIAITLLKFVIVISITLSNNEITLSCHAWRRWMVAEGIFTKEVNIYKHLLPKLKQFSGEFDDDES